MDKKQNKNKNRKIDSKIICIGYDFRNKTSLTNEVIKA